MSSALCCSPCCATSSRATFSMVASSTRCTLVARRMALSAVTSLATASRSLSGLAGSDGRYSDASWSAAEHNASRMSLLANRPPLPFFSPLGGKDPTNGKPGGAPNSSNEAEVDDHEWEMRVARGMLHLRETLPLLFTSASSKELFPDDIFSKNLVLRLPQPLPLKVSSLQGYSVAFNIARNGMQALHSDLDTVLERMTFTASPSPESPTAAVRESLKGNAPTHRQKQIRVLLNVTGKPRLPPHHNAEWRTSSLYTFSPYSGLIAVHEVETIRPLPGEGVADWLMKGLLGWTGRSSQSEGALGLPRAIKVPIENDPILRSRLNRKE